MAVLFAAAVAFFESLAADAALASTISSIATPLAEIITSEAGQGVIAAATGLSEAEVAEAVSLPAQLASRPLTGTIIDVAKDTISTVAKGVSYGKATINGARAAYGHLRTDTGEEGESG